MIGAGTVKVAGVRPELVTVPAVQVTEIVPPAPVLGTVSVTLVAVLLA